MKVKYLPLLALLVGLGASSAGARERTFGDGLPEYLRQFDVNDDGVLDEEERQAIRAAREAKFEDWIAQWDADGNGVLDQTEIAAARDAIRAAIEAKRAEHFNSLDTDGDGCLSLEEFSAIPALSDADPARVEALFNRMDTDDDQKVTLEEFTARLRHHRKPGHDRPRR